MFTIEVTSGDVSYVATSDNVPTRLIFRSYEEAYHTMRKRIEAGFFAVADTDPCKNPAIVSYIPVSAVSRITIS